MEHREDSDTERPAGRAAVVMMPDGSILMQQVNRAAPLPSARRTDVRSVEQPHQPAEPYSGARISAINLPEAAPLSSKPDAAPGPAPLGGLPPQMYMYDGAIPGRLLTSPATSHRRAPVSPQPAFSQLAGAPGRAPEPVNYPSQPYPSKPDTPIPGPAPDHVPQKPVPGPAPEGHSQQTPAHHMYPVAQPTPRYLPPAQPDLSQYQPCQPVQYAVPGPTAPHVRHEQHPPQAVEKPIGILKAKTLGHNQCYISVCLCILLTVLCNPLAFICCISAFYYATKASNEYKKNNYSKAIRFKQNAQYLNIGGYVYLVAAGFICIPVVIVVVPLVIVNAVTLT